MAANTLDPPVLTAKVNQLVADDRLHNTALGLLVLLIQLSSNAVQGAYQSLIPDQVPPAQHSVAAGVKSLVEMPAVILGPLVTGLILGLANWTLTVRVSSWASSRIKSGLPKAY